MVEDDATSSGLSPKLQVAMELICALCDERITQEQFNDLESQVCGDAEIRAFYVETMHLHAGLYYFASAMSEMDALSTRLGEDGVDEPPSLGMDETMVMPAMTGSSSLDEFEELALPGPSSISETSPDKPRPGWVTKAGIAAVLTIGLGLLAYFLPSLGEPQAGQYASPIVRAPWYVATLDVTASPVWAPAGMPTHDGKYVAGESLVLQSGAVQLQLRHQGRLVVEGPAEVRFVSDCELRVARGRVVARYPGGGLVIQCPMGVVRDLGTEFGVAVSADGQTEVAVFKGRVSASRSEGSTGPAAAPPGTPPASPSGKELVLTVGQAATLSSKAVAKIPEGAVPQRFICNLQNLQVTSLDVADLIGGGDGTTQRRGIAVDALTGSIGKLSPVVRRTGDHAYHPVIGFPVVDGAFIPDGSAGTTIVDSAGDRFQFPPTTNATVNHIWTGGSIPWTDDTGKALDVGISTVLSGIDYATDKHSIICTHSNNAITLDLDAVRRLYPDREIMRFTCQFGNSFINGWPGSTRVNPAARVFVLVNGRSRYEKASFTNQDGAIPIDLQISKTDRFMTLAAVDDGKDIDRDWILWTDARFEVSPAVGPTVNLNVK